MADATEIEKFWDETFKRLDLHGLLLDWGRDLLEAKYPTFIEVSSTAMVLRASDAMTLRESYRSSACAHLASGLGIGEPKEL